MSNKIIKDLTKFKEKEYKNFTSKLIPNIEDKYILGVRLPIIKKYAKSINGTKDADSFINELPHHYHEEYLLHGFIINQIKDYTKVINELDKLLPYVNNWAVCDSISPQIFKKHHQKLLKDINRWLKSKEIYKRRFAVKMLMTHFLDEDFDNKHLELVRIVKNDDYYIMMMCAWYYATALAKQYDATIPYLKNKKLDKEVHNKTIQKAIESYRISEAKKEELKELKI